MKINIAKGPPTKLQKASIKADKERQEEAIHSSRVTADHLDNLAQEMRNVGARLEKHGELYSSEA